jgi:type IV secretion system protein VirB9
MLKKFLKIFLFTIFLVNNAFSAQLPRYLGSEKKFRSFVYNPNDVYRYLGHYTYQGFIEFEGDESISTISMGNPSLWLFEHLGNRLFLKPVGENNSETNMTVITNKRVYHFELLAKEAKGITDKDLVFVVKFVYPDEKDKNIVKFPPVPESDEPDLRDLTKYNFDYKYTGEPNIAPMKIFDNGEFTYFQFSKKNAEIPAVFTVDAQGYESLVNYRAAGDYIIIERVAPQYTLRNGSDIVCVYNNRLFANGYLGVNNNNNFGSSNNFTPPVQSFAPPPPQMKMQLPPPQSNSMMPDPAMMPYNVNEKMPPMSFTGKPENNVPQNLPYPIPGSEESFNQAPSPNVDYPQSKIMDPRNFRGEPNMPSGNSPSALPSSQAIPPNMQADFPSFRMPGQAY